MDSKEYKLPKRSPILVEILTAGAWALITAVITVFIPAFSFWWHIFFWAQTVLLVLTGVFYIPLYMNSIKLSIGPSVISFESGVFVNRKRFMKRERVVFVTVFNTPFTPIFKISSLKIAATGSKIGIPFVDKDDADEIAVALSPDSN